MSEEHRPDLDTIAFPFQRKRDTSTKLVAAVQVSYTQTRGSSELRFLQNTTNERELQKRKKGRREGKR